MKDKKHEKDGNGQEEREVEMYSVESDIIDQNRVDDSLHHTIHDIQDKINKSTTADEIKGTRTNPTRPPRIIRLGVVAEHEGNSSPGICLVKVLELLAANGHINDDENRHENIDENIDKNDDNKKDTDKNKSNNDHIKHNNDNVKIELIFFNRPNPISFFSYILSPVSKVVPIDHLDLEGARRLIAAERVDILLYMALPTEKFTTFLSQSRLAPVQVHPPAALHRTHTHTHIYEHIHMHTHTCTHTHTHTDTHIDTYTHTHLHTHTYTHTHTYIFIYRRSTFEWTKFCFCFT